MVDNRKSLRVFMDLELRPGWAASPVVGNEDFWLQFDLSKINLSGAADELRNQLARFPERAIDAS